MKLDTNCSVNGDNKGIKQVLDAVLQLMFGWVTLIKFIFRE